MSLHVLVIDRFGYVGDGICRHLRLGAGEQVRGGRLKVDVVPTVQAALVAIGQEPPDMICVDLSAAQESVIGVVGLLRRSAPQAKVVVLSVSDHSWLVAQMLKVGVHGFVLKSMGHAEIAQIFRRVLAGQVSIPRSVYGQWRANPPHGHRQQGVVRDGSLTQEEQCLLFGMIRGTSMGDLARTLGCDEQTASRRTEHFRERWGCGSVEEWCRLGVVYGVIPPDPEWAPGS